jgi:predicted nuclease of predicted toxin-antitoxin system
VKFLIDEDVPVKVLKFLTAAGHDAVRVTSGSPDQDIAQKSVSESRVLLTLDKDFSDRLVYSPSKFSIVCFRIHPPFADDLIEALRSLLHKASAADLRGLTLVQRDGELRITE